MVDLCSGRARRKEEETFQREQVMKMRGAVQQQRNRLPATCSFSAHSGSRKEHGEVPFSLSHFPLVLWQKGCGTARLAGLVILRQEWYTVPRERSDAPDRGIPRLLRRRRGTRTTSTSARRRSHRREVKRTTGMPSCLQKESGTTVIVGITPPGGERGGKLLLRR